MSGSFRLRYWFELAAAAASGGLVLLTLLWHDWIEIAFRVDPDHGNGWLEWLVAATFLGLAIVFLAGARQERNCAARRAEVSRAS